MWSTTEATVVVMNQYHDNLGFQEFRSQVAILLQSGKFYLSEP